VILVRKGAHCFLVVCLVLFVFGRLSAAGSSVEVLSIRHWSAPDHTRIVFDLNRPAAYDVFELTGPDRLVIQLHEARCRLSGKEYTINDQVISTVRWGYFTPTTLRVVVDLIHSTNSTVFMLKRLQDKPDRLVIDVVRPDLQNQEQQKRSVSREKAPGTRIIVIDPGHGGEDPGALGASGLQEKTVVLGVAKKLCAALNQQKGLKAFLTREKDYFVPLRNRWQIAKDYNADLFISIHTNGSFNRNKQGAEVYCLSASGASQEAARILASQENASDLIGGVSLASCPSEAGSLIVNLAQTRTINESLLFGRGILQELTAVTRVNFPCPLQAGFAVLKAPDIPSVLVELGYITHPREEKKLADGNFQNSIVRALVRATNDFLSQMPVETASMVGERSSGQR